MSAATLSDIARIAQRAAAYQAEIDAARRRAASPAFGWYPYDSLGSFFALDGVLTGPRRDLLGAIGSDPVLDIGAGDGHNSFFLASLGCRVVAIDNPATNFNGMQGIRALRDALNLPVEILECDADNGLSLPHERYSVTFLLGILYHLKNPLLVLESLARKSRNLILSTRVARFAPDGTRIQHLPVGYLVNPTETNDDVTNFWIFSDAGLERLLDRAGWIIRDYRNLGNLESSDPASWQGDERAFLWAERKSNVAIQGNLLAGWHDPEGLDQWRWTARAFSAQFDGVAGKTALRFEFYVPPAAIDSGPLTVSVRINGSVAASLRCEQEGLHHLRAPLPAGAPSLRLDFETDRALSLPGEERELGVIAARLELK